MYVRIRALREDRDLSQSEVAKYLNVHQTTYSVFELGNIDVAVSILIKLADFYNTNIEYLVGRTAITTSIKDDNRSRRHRNTKT